MKYPKMAREDHLRRQILLEAEQRRKLTNTSSPLSSSNTNEHRSENKHEQSNQTKERDEEQGDLEKPLLD